MERKQLGQLGEKLAADFLRKRGYRVMERNYRTPGGEIDIVARQGSTLVFVEVRTKSGPSFGTPEESITAAKRSRMVGCGMAYLQSHGDSAADWRIDVVAIEMGPSGKPSRIEVIPNAVGF